MKFTKTYISTPAIIEAIQFTNGNKDAVHMWAREKQGNVYASTIDGEPVLLIPTLEGEAICRVGDYLIVEPYPTDWRKIYSLKEEIFNERYEIAK